jgi:hypothetical protein
MFVNTCAKHEKLIAWLLLSVFYVDIFLVPRIANAAGGHPTYFRRPETSIKFPLESIGSTSIVSKFPSPTVSSPAKKNGSQRINPAGKKNKADIGGPTQPESQAFTSVNSNNMVDLFSGDFSYSIPLMDVGGYPLNLSYRSGITMDQEASWVGLGWNINPGSITRNLRGLPDDFTGSSDSITKTTSVKENKTVGVSLGADLELVGAPINVGVNFGLFNNNYKGWGTETGINASINSGQKSNGGMTAGLSITNNSQDGISVSPSLSVRLSQYDCDEKAGYGGSLSIGASYSSRAGLKALQVSSSLSQTRQNEKNQKGSYGSSFPTSMISFASPTFNPTITIPYTSSQYSYTAKVGFEGKVVHPSFYVNGYVSRQEVAAEDTTLSLPSYGYMHFQDANKNPNALLDYNREKEIPYRETPAVPNIAIPMYTYDAFSISGEGTGGMFRPYRGDIGYVNDHFMRTKDKSDRFSVDIGFGDLVHAGVDINVNRAFTQTGPWLNQNTMKDVVGFSQKPYFKNPGEKAIISKDFYNAIGGDDLVSVDLYQAGRSSSVIQATSYMTRYKDKQPIGKLHLTSDSAIRKQRDKRTQVITYLNAQEASQVGLSKYIENYLSDSCVLPACEVSLPTEFQGLGSGLKGEYFVNDETLTKLAYTQTDPLINFDLRDIANEISKKQVRFKDNTTVREHFSIRWTGYIKAPATGTYTFKTFSDDGVRLKLNDKWVIDNFTLHSPTIDQGQVNLVAGEVYTVQLEYFQKQGDAVIVLGWQYPGQSLEVIPTRFLYPPSNPTEISVSTSLTLEKRVNTFRKANHISEINVLNDDGRKYVYGIPVYNLKQKEATFAVSAAKGSADKSMVGYVNGIDNSTKNTNGKDWYFNSEQVPAYAHTFLLTGIVSPDYVDITGNGISDDDLGDAVKFDYSKISGLSNPYKWRAPFSPDSVSYNEGLKTDNRDDKGNYVYGEKELWYLHAVESKTMVAFFVLENRNDLPSIGEDGHVASTTQARRLKEIRLYSKAEFKKKGYASAKPIKVVHFDYSYELCSKASGDSGKLTLKKVWFTYNGNDHKASRYLTPYVFNYNSNNPGYSPKSNDRWGTYKDPSSNPNSISGNIISNSDYPYAIQDSTVAAQNAAAWDLDSINLPSGGSMKVSYESDDYAYVQNRRAMQLFQIVGLSNTSTFSSSNKLYDNGNENLYLFVKVPFAVQNTQQLYDRYLSAVKKLYFKIFVQMPTDRYGSGYENVSGYADLDLNSGYGIIDDTTIWIKVNTISLKNHNYSPLATAAVQFLRLNLPSKAYPGSEMGDNLDLKSAVQMIATAGPNIKEALNGYDDVARGKSWAQVIDLKRSYVRLNSPTFKKYGGGHRVKRITIYDNWDKMTGQKKALYGKEYTYTTDKVIGTDTFKISSGVASYEPGIGGEENPFHQPIEYTEQIAPLGPVTLGYIEEPLGESLFPSAGVGYSKVRVRTINYKNARSANGFEESSFYTGYDFPTYTDKSLLGDDAKKRYKPALANFLRINAKHYVAATQGFKIELNDMHGKLRSQATYAETDFKTPVTYTENIYKVIDPNASSKTLKNDVYAIAPDGSIDTSAIIGKDVELMMDMREQVSVTNGNNININGDLFTIPFPLPPVMLIPSLLSLGQREETQFKSVAVTKVVQRYGILDSVIQIDKGSKISTRDMLYDAETGNTVLSRTQNEFNDPIYNVNYPSHWAYDVMGLAYKNIDFAADHVTFSKGKITSGLSLNDSLIFSSGDEILIGGKQKTGDGLGLCQDQFSTFPSFDKIWAVDSSIIFGGPKSFYFVDRKGQPYSGSDASIRIIRSGRRNINAAVGAITFLNDPMVKAGGNWTLQIDSNKSILNASAGEYRQVWKVGDKNLPRQMGQTIHCPPDTCHVSFPATYQEVQTATCLSPSHDPAYSISGPYIYSSASDSVGIPIDDETGYWENRSGSNGRLNSVGIWFCDSCQYDGCHPVYKWMSISQSLNIPVSDTFFVGVGADNQERVKIDGVQVLQILQKTGHYGDDGIPFFRWHIFPLYLTKGIHNLTIDAWNSGGPASFGMEIYQATRNQVINSVVNSDTATANAFTIFSTKDLTDGYAFQQGYSCPIGYNLDSTGGVFTCTGTGPCPCDTLIDGTCKSAVTDTLVNPYVFGVLGNPRLDRSYVYYADRKESDPNAVSDIRRDGTIASFMPFWKFQDSSIVPQYDTTRWVWNTASLKFNKRGLELENKDPLNRYNSGIYGYNDALPVAVAQNGRYRESAFEGFEDYNFETSTCDTSCPVSRHFDFSPFLSSFDTTQKHTGKYSLKVAGGNSITFQTTVDTATDVPVPLNYTSAFTCTALAALKSIKTNKDALLPVFSPINGKRMLISAWVKEDQPCNSQSYQNNQISIVFSGGSAVTLTFKPSGPIIEGWQRYEAYFDVPADATNTMQVQLQATGSVNVYFDDIRLHPFNANMKSYVYDDLNLRLMAELDENNYATFYEYDDDGSLVRVKKETEQGIKTIQETRNSMMSSQKN